jgi:CBS domain-containing protein
MDELITAGEICNRSVVFATGEMPVNEAARLMREEHVGSLVVIEETARGRVVAGILTDRDIAIAVVARDLDSATLRVGDYMSRDVVTARPEDSVNAVLSQMRRNGIRRVPVTTTDNILIGIVTLDDLLEIVAEELRGLVQAIESEKKRETHIRG